MGCAVKIIGKEQMSTSQMRKERIINELKIIENLIHPNIARVYEILHDQENFYIVTEYVKSGDLANLCTLIAKNERKLLHQKVVKRIAY